MRPIALLALIFGFMAQQILDGEIFTHAIIGIIFGIIAVTCGLASARHAPPHRWQGRIMAVIGLMMSIGCAVSLPSAYVRQVRWNKLADRVRQQQQQHAAQNFPTNTSPDDCSAVYEQSFWKNVEGFRAHMDSYTNILVITVDENHAEDQGPHRSGLLYFKGTVVKSYKGDWRVSEKISFVHSVDYQPLTTVSNQAVGETFFVFTNEYTNTDIALDTGDFGQDTNTEQVLQCFFSRPGR